MAKKLKKPENETKLERVVRYWLNNRGADYQDGWKGAYKDLAYGGCQSGVVGELIYYHDTLKFFTKHRDEITKLLKEQMSDMGAGGPKELFGSKWDDEDPLAAERFNQNLLAWFAFEETARSIAHANGYDE